jgi:hypothetical protein
VRAQDIKVGEVAMIGGIAFTKLRQDGPLTKSSLRQRARFVEVLNVARVESEKGGTWIEVMFRGGDSPANERVMFALYRPFEIVKIQVEKE